MIRVGTRINVRPHARKKQVWGKVVLERVVQRQTYSYQMNSIIRICQIK